MAVKLSITMNEKLLERVDEFCADNFQSRSGIIALALKSYLDGNSVMSNLAKLSNIYDEQTRRGDKID